MSDHVVLVRPGHTDFDDQHRIKGSLGVPLNDRGTQQVSRIVEQLRHVPLELIYSDPSEPSRSTAAAIGAALGVRVKETDGLRNLRQGLWEGLPEEDVRRKFAKVYKQWQESPGTVCPPEGEMVGDVMERARKAIHKPLKKKRSFAVVVSEPMATLVRCVVEGEDHPTFKSQCCCDESRLVEYVVVGGAKNGNGNGAESKPAGNGHADPTPNGSGNGRH
ncbi:MAG: histidine phosphatase family protein [Planctomycetota bacterium]|nr:histidine phosphatase family protein [Planctomycetota bacterium]